MNLNRTEELEIKRDLGRIRKALEDISDKVVPVSKNTQVVVKDGDPFFGKIYMSVPHLEACNAAYQTRTLKMIALIEECSELQQALTKMYKSQDQAYLNGGYSRANLIEEMAHVMICIKMLSQAFNISADAIQQEIYKKYPDGYDLAITMADNKSYYYVPKEGQ